MNDGDGLVIQVTLSAKPEIRGGAVVRKYSLTTEGLMVEID
jgi:hypothetical protein